MFKKFTNGCVRVVNRWLPDAFLFAVILTIVVFLGAMVATGMGPVAMLNAWGNDKGFWGLLSFSMQMALVLVFGSAMASAKVCKKGLGAIASLAHNNKQAIVITTFVSVICCWVNWGFGLVAGALLAKEIAKRVRTVDYPLLIASAYSGFVIWHAGFSGSIPLDLVKGKEFAGVVYQAPITETIFHPVNLVMVLIILIAMPFINYAMHPDKEHTICVDPTLLENEAERTYKIETPADKMEHSKILWAILLVFCWGYIVYYFATQGFKLGLNIVNFLFMTLGLTLHGNLRKYVDAIADATGGAAGVLLQFPFYAGIMGSRYRELLRSLRRRPVGCPGSHHDACRRCSGHPRWSDRHGRGLGRPVDQHDPALLGSACSWYRRSVCPRCHGLSGGHPAVHRRPGLRRLPGLGHAVSLSLTVS